MRSSSPVAPRATLPRQSVLQAPEGLQTSWELKYCPYGVLVELMPFPDSKDMEQRMAESGFPGWTPEFLYSTANNVSRKR
jgi:hypothetical protein